MSEMWGNIGEGDQEEVIVGKDRKWGGKERENDWNDRKGVP